MPAATRRRPRPRSAPDSRPSSNRYKPQVFRCFLGLAPAGAGNLQIEIITIPTRRAVHRRIANRSPDSRNRVRRRTCGLSGQQASRRSQGRRCRAPARPRAGSSCRPASRGRGPGPVPADPAIHAATGRPPPPGPAGRRETIRHRSVPRFRRAGHGQRPRRRRSGSPGAGQAHPEAQIEDGLDGVPGLYPLCGRVRRSRRAPLARRVQGDGRRAPDLSADAAQGAAAPTCGCASEAQEDRPGRGLKGAGRAATPALARRHEALAE